ncbi:MAG: hypothetical protein JWO66_978 [Candidatus Eremiobacteraeota bacterium]|jgi:hypothetical protein|nr:hypothetical protein [Candidatus Eremiobacteraeota bacterium]
MDADRARVVVALQSALMRSVGEFGDVPGFDAYRPRALATAAALDYVLMLATGTTGVRIPERDAERAIHDGIARAVDELIAVASAIARAGTPEGVAFAREAATSLRDVLRTESLQRDDRTFAVIALANA